MVLRAALGHRRGGCCAAHAVAHPDRLRGFSNVNPSCSASSHVRTGNGHAAQIPIPTSTDKISTSHPVAARPASTGKMIHSFKCKALGFPPVTGKRGQSKDGITDLTFVAQQPNLDRQIPHERTTTSIGQSKQIDQDGYSRCCSNVSKIRIR